MHAVPADDAAAAVTARAEARRVRALRTIASDQQARLGQFFTPERAAALIASLPRLPEAGRLRVLDPGAGSGSLSAAFTARVLRERPALELDIVAVEIDPGVGRHLHATLADLTDTARAAGVTVATEMVWGDYIELVTSATKPAALEDPFDIVIMNPPYRKLGLSSAHRRTLLQQGAACPNLYAAFLTLGASALDPGGQLVAITPRSFTNGPHFGQFRRFLLEALSLDRLHVFQSRCTVFSDTGVLQENVAFSGTRQGSNDKVVLSVSRGPEDTTVERVVSYFDVVHPGDAQHVIRIVADDDGAAVAETMATLPATLDDLNVQVSTGKVVDFRARENLRKSPGPDTVPLIYPGNMRHGIVEWPREIRKHQGFALRSEVDRKKFLLPAGFYVVIKRFSAKEERRRVVAAVWDLNRNTSPVAFENHLNILHADGAGLDRDLAVGLSYWFNSSLVDTFFRTFSGHTQVNATDLRTLRFPPLDALTALGQRQEIPLPAQHDIDRLIEDVMSDLECAQPGKTGVARREPLDHVLRARRVVTGDGYGEVARCVGVGDGRIVAIEPYDSPIAGAVPGERLIDLAQDEVLLPGLVDTHVHVNEPGRTEWEGFACATRAAALGGVTTLIDMPLNCVPPTIDVAALEHKQAAAGAQVYVDVGFWGGAVPGNRPQLRALHDAGVFGFKAFLLPSGVAEFPPLPLTELEQVLAELAGFGTQLLVHAEDAQTIARAATPRGERYGGFLTSRPRGAENLAIAWLVERARWTGAHVHVLHLSSSDALPMIASARRDGVRLSVETCPHYLTFTAEEVPDGATEFKCCPPIREAPNRELLWAGLADGVIDAVVSDHSPCPVALKHRDTGDFGAAWGGIASLQLGLPAVWSAARRRGHELTDVVGWMAEAPARLAGLTRKGRIAVGFDADLCVFAPDQAFVVDGRELAHRHPLTPYHGRELSGTVRQTWLRGHRIDVGGPPRGALLRRGSA